MTASQVAMMQISRITILKIHQKHHLRLQKKSSDTDKFKSEKKKLEQDMENEKKNLTINSGDWAKKDRR